MNDDDTLIRIGRRHWELEFDVGEASWLAPALAPDAGSGAWGNPAGTCPAAQNTAGAISKAGGAPARPLTCLDQLLLDLRLAWLDVELWAALLWFQ